MPQYEELLIIEAWLYIAMIQLQICLLRIQVHEGIASDQKRVTIIRQSCKFFFELVASDCHPQYVQ